MVEGIVKEGHVAFSASHTVLPHLLRASRIDVAVACLRTVCVRARARFGFSHTSLLCFLASHLVRASSPLELFAVSCHCRNTHRHGSV